MNIVPWILTAIVGFFALSEDEKKEEKPKKTDFTKLPPGSKVKYTEEGEIEEVTVPANPPNTQQQPTQQQNTTPPPTTQVQPGAQPIGGTPPTQQSSPPQTTTPPPPPPPQQQEDSNLQDYLTPLIEGASGWIFGQDSPLQWLNPNNPIYNQSQQPQGTVAGNYVIVPPGASCPPGMSPMGVDDNNNIACL